MSSLWARLKRDRTKVTERAEHVRRPTMEPVCVKKLPRLRVFFPWNFGVPRDIWLNSMYFWPRFGQFRLRPISNHFAGRTWPIFTNFDLFCWADLTYFHLFGPIAFHNKAPWAGHLKNADFCRNRRYSQVHPFSWNFKHLEGRFSQKTAGNRRLGSVILGPSPLVRPYSRMSQRKSFWICLKLWRTFND